MLQPSMITEAGIGCFAVHPIAAGTRVIAPNPTGPNRHLELDEIPLSHLKYCPLMESGKYLAPADFNHMSPFWYINHDRDPNIRTEAWRLFAARDIAAGEELTLYYPDLLTHPMNASWVVPELHV